MPTAPESIFVVDDESASMYGSVLKNIFPQSPILAFRDVEEAIEAMASGSRPDLLFLDATEHGWHPEWGADNAYSILDWLKVNAPEQPLPHIVFQSNDEELSAKSKSLLKRQLYGENIEITFDVIDTEKSELQVIQDIVGFEEGGTHITRIGRNFTKLREFLNSRYDYNLPTTQEDIDELALSKGSTDPQAILRLVEKGKMSRDDALSKIAPKLESQIVYEYSSQVEAYGEDYDTNRAMSLHFQRGTEQPVTGPAAFSHADIVALAGKGSKPILITEDVTPEIIQLFGSIAGLVVLSQKASGHVEMLAQAHRIPALLGRTNIHRDAGKPRVKLHASSAAPYLTLQTSVNLLNGTVKADTLIRRGVEEIKLIAPHKQATPKDEDGYGNERVTHRIKMTIRAGDQITIDPPYTLYAVYLPINERENRSNSWLPEARTLVCDWHEDNNFVRLKFKQNIDDMGQLYSGNSNDGIGLVRTEHLVISSGRTLQAFRDFVLRGDERALEDFESRQQNDFINLMDVICRADDYPLRIRLIDAPPSEFFDEQGLSDIETRYGDRSIRGVQLAVKAPELYDAQLRAIFSSYKELKDKGQDSDFYEAPKSPVEIMVPTVRTVDELMFVKARAEVMAADHGLTRDDYRFGSMLETIDACDNIAAIAPLCDFISIGSNDLTSEILNCGRDDWARRRKLTVESGKGADPFITMHADVVAKLVETIEQAYASNPTLQVDLCGAHAADLPSLNALRPLELNGVSAPPSPQNQDGLSLLYMMDTFKLHPAKPIGKRKKKNRSPKPSV